MGAVRQVLIASSLAHEGFDDFIAIEKHLDEERIKFHLYFDGDTCAAMYSMSSSSLQGSLLLAVVLSSSCYRMMSQ